MRNEAENLKGLSPIKRAVLAVDDLRARLEMVERERTEPIAITGIGCRFPGGANDPESFWKLLRDGVDAITEVPRERWDAEATYDPDATVRGKTNARWGAFLEQVDQFDASFFGISPREATHMDPQQRLVLEVVWEALEDAGQPVERLAGTATGVFLGIYNNDYAWLQSNEMEDVDIYAATGAGQGIAANRVSYLLDLHGPSIAVDTTCSSSLVAVHLACQSLRSGECRVALAGGVNLILSPLIALSVSKIVPMAADGRCKTFDARADGIVRGEGCGIVVLKRLSDAVADNDNIIAVIRGSAVNQDGHSNGFTAPNSAAQQRVIRQALKNAGVDASQISYVEAHGTGTPLGDPIELEALDGVVGSQRTNGDSCAVGSVKNNLGHLEAAAGIAGLIKVALSIKHRAIPPHLHFTQLNPLASTNGSLKIPTELLEWKDKSEKLYAGISSFSLGGTNAHVVVGQAPQASATDAEDRDQVYVLPLSARSQAGLEAYAREFRNQILEQSFADSTTLYDLAYAASFRRSHLPYRLALVGRTHSELANLVDSFIEGQMPRGLSSGRVGRTRQGLVFVFSGQGANWRGMGRNLMDQEPVFRAALAECQELFAKHGIPDLIDQLKRDDDDPQLNSAEFVQAATFAIQVGLTALFREWGIKPDAVIGHSIGEIAAAYSAGILTLEDSVRVVSARARLFERIIGNGGMAAVELTSDEAHQVLKEFSGISLAAHNSPTSTVLSGESQALQSAVESLRLKQVQCRYLHVNCAFHSQQVEPLLAELRESLQGLTPQRSSIRFESTVMGKSIDGDQLDADYWVRNGRETVCFAEAIENLGQDYDIFLEVSAHPILAHSIMQCLESRERPVQVVTTLRRDTDERTMLLRSLAKLYTIGHPVRWEGLFPERARHVRLPSYPWQRTRFWIQAEDRRSAAPTGKQLSSNTNAPPHSLLGRRLQTPAHMFESTLSVASLKYLNQHLIDGNVVFPAACYLEMAIGLAQEYFPSGQRIVRDLIFHEPLILASDRDRTLQSMITPDSSGSATIQIFSFEESDEPERSFWKLHATGQICRTTERHAAVPATSLDALRATFCSEVALDVLNQVRSKYGFESGGEFQGIEKLWRTEEQTLGQVRLPNDLLDELSKYSFHPALLDACFQTLMAIVPQDDEGNPDDQVYLATGVEQFNCPGSASSEIWSHVVFRPTDDSNQETRTVDVHLYDSTGNVVAEVQGLSLKRVTKRALRFGSQHSSECYYEVQWQPKRLATPSEQCDTHLSVATVDLVGRVRPQLRDAVERFGLNKFRKIEPEVDSLCANYILEALSNLGISLQVGQRISLRSLVKQSGILPRFGRLLERLFEILSEDQILVGDSDEWEVRLLPQVTAESRWRVLIDAFPTHKAELSLLGRCGSNLAKVLSGKVDPLELLFPGGSLTEAEHLYQSSPIAKTFNTLLEQGLRLAVEKLREGDTLRILEIGAGTGGSTSYVLPLLPREQTEYVFTDVSNLFLFKARQKFGDYPFLDFKLLDIERDPQEQGFGRQQFDVVIASNVLHGTSDLRSSVKYVQQLLASGGLLVLLESTGPQRLVDLTFGLTEDWWEFRDSDLRPKHPLLSTGKWLDLLTDVGFTGVAAIPEPADANTDTLQTALIFAQAPSRSPEERAQLDRSQSEANGSWVVFTDGSELGKKIAGDLRSRGATVTEVYPPSAQSKTSDSRTAKEQYTELLSEISESSKCGGVIYLWSLSASATRESTPAISVGTTALDDCDGVLNLVQAIAEIGLAESPRLWIVTRGAQPVAAGDATFTLPSSTLWGLGATISMEHPEMWGG
jgi:acyl transferase domain-containing protein/SAM-dependent methyltransferase